MRIPAQTQDDGFLPLLSDANCRCRVDAANTPTAAAAIGDQTLMKSVV
jgi:hypothetical protein